MHSPDWLDALTPHAVRLAESALPDLIGGDPARATDFALRVGPLYLSQARQRQDRAAREALFELARRLDLAAALRALFDGDKVNASEGRPALHTALRSDLGRGPVAQAARREALDAAAQVERLAAQLETSGITDVVNIGIGGSDLGPRLAVDALRHQASGRFRLHFVANVDGAAAQGLLPNLDPARTAAVLVSKSFSTQETLLNGAILRKWMGDDERLYAVSANVDRARAFGVAPERVLPMFDWVGGRYSLWSAVGLAPRLALGKDGFAALLGGAAAMDAHVLEAPVERNLAAWQALAWVFNRDALGYDSLAVLPYDQRLALLPEYLQQLVMESLGKSVTVAGEPVQRPTVPVLWGGVGSSVQHSFFQALHQGTDTVPMEFIGVRQPDHPHPANHRALLANLLAQSEALANGQSHPDPQRAYAGGRPSTVILLDRLDADALGRLLALYEHAVYLTARIWNINAFDQFGVELGKRIADGLLPALTDPTHAVADAVTCALLAELREPG
jgi:glucose-6-phosphate isomerase